MNVKKFTELIDRVLSGQATKKEMSIVERWLASRSEKDPFDRLSVHEKEMIRVDMLKSVSTKMGEADGLKAKAPIRRYYRVAAAILLLSVLSYAIFQMTPSRLAEKIPVIHSISSTEGSKKVILSDGSIVWLKAKSSIDYPQTFDDDVRLVRLTGEALFEVSKNPDRPFIIQCGNLTAKVLGTSFSIKSGPEDIEVLVLTGKIELSSKGKANPVIVHPNEKVVYDKEQEHIEKIVATEVEKTAKINGTEYSMRFRATQMGEIIRRIEGKFDVHVLLSDERLRRCTITADFTDQSLERTLSMICQTLQIEYEINESTVVLTGTGCEDGADLHIQERN